MPLDQRLGRNSHRLNNDIIDLPQIFTSSPMNSKSVHSFLIEFPCSYGNLPYFSIACSFLLPDWRLADSTEKNTKPLHPWLRNKASTLTFSVAQWESAMFHFFLWLLLFFLYFQGCSFSDGSILRCLSFTKISIIIVEYLLHLKCLSEYFSGRAL